MPRRCGQAASSYNSFEGHLAEIPISINHFHIPLSHFFVRLTSEDDPAVLTTSQLYYRT